GTIGDKIDAELALGRLHARIDLARRHMEAFGIQLKVVNERFHRSLHLAALGRHHLLVVGDVRPLPRRRQQACTALLHDLYGLAHLFHADAVAIVVVAVLADRNIEIELAIALVGLGLAQIPGGARAAQHHAREAPSQTVPEADHTNVDVAL